MFVRRAAELLSRNRVLKRRMRIAGTKAPIFVSPDAQLKYLKPSAQSFDYDLVRIAEKVVCENDVVFDIGANVGVFSVGCLACHANVEVLAIEADPWLSEILTRTSMLPEYLDRRFDILPAAVSNEFGVAELLIANRGRASNALAEFNGRSQMGGVRCHQFVPTVTVDYLSEKFAAPTFLKIDVEGAEVAVLKGALRAIKEYKPTIYVETSPKSFIAARELLAPLGYGVFDQDGRPTDSHHSNVFFVHLDAQTHLANIKSLSSEILGVS